MFDTVIPFKDFRKFDLEYMLLKIYEASELVYEILV